MSLPSTYLSASQYLRLQVSSLNVHFKTVILPLFMNLNTEAALYLKGNTCLLLDWNLKCLGDIGTVLPLEVKSTLGTWPTYTVEDWQVESTGQTLLYLPFLTRLYDLLNVMITFLIFKRSAFSCSKICWKFINIGSLNILKILPSILKVYSVFTCMLDGAENFL